MTVIVQNKSKLNVALIRKHFCAGSWIIQYKLSKNTFTLATVKLRTFHIYKHTKTSRNTRREGFFIQLKDTPVKGGGTVLRVHQDRAGE